MVAAFCSFRSVSIHIPSSAWPARVVKVNSESNSISVSYTHLDVYKRQAVASLTAFLVGSFLNAYVMSKMKLASGGKNFSLRAITSTLVGESARCV